MSSWAYHLCFSLAARSLHSKSLLNARHRVRCWGNKDNRVAAFRGAYSLATMPGVTETFYLLVDSLYIL